MVMEMVIVGIYYSTVFELFGSLKGEVMTFLPPEVPFV
jgi:hypothetical protein